MVQFLMNTFYKSLRTTSPDGWRVRMYLYIWEKNRHTWKKKRRKKKKKPPEESLNLYKSFPSFICNYCSVLIDISPPIIKRPCKSRQQVSFQNLLPWFKVLKQKQKEVTLKTGGKIQPRIYVIDNYQTVGNA